VDGLSGIIRLVSEVTPVPVAEAPTEPEPAPEMTPSEADPSTVAATPTGASGLDRWVYLGWIVTPTSRHALVRIDSKQHLIVEGGERENAKVVKVERDHIMVDPLPLGEEGGPERRIDCAKANGLWAQGTPVGVDPALTQDPRAAAQAARMEAMKRMNARARQFPGHDNKDSAGGGKGEGTMMTEESGKKLAERLQQDISDEERLRAIEDAGILPGASASSRARALFNAGIPVGYDPVTAMAMKRHGIDPEAGEKAVMQLETVEENGGNPEQ
jgi:hypothetical protein